MMNNEEDIDDDPLSTDKIVHILDKWNASKLATRDTNSFKDYEELTEAENEIARIFKNQGSSDGLNKSIIHFLMEKGFKEKHNEEHEYFTERKVLVEKIQKWLDRSPLFKLNLTSKRWECYYGNYGDGKDAKILWDKVLRLRFAWSLEDSSKRVENLQLRIQSFKEIIKLSNPGSTVGQLTQKLCSMIIIPYSLELIAECGRIIKTIECEPNEEDTFSCTTEESLSSLHKDNKQEQTENGDKQVNKVIIPVEFPQKEESNNSENEESENMTVAENESLDLKSSKDDKELENNDNNKADDEKKSEKEKFVIVLKKCTNNGSRTSSEYKVDEINSHPGVSNPDETDDSSDEDIFSSSVTQALEKSAAMTSEFEEPLSPAVSSNIDSRSSEESVPSSIGSSVISPIVIPDDNAVKPQLSPSVNECLQRSQISSADEDTKPKLSPQSSENETAESLSNSSSETLSAPSSPQNEFRKTPGLQVVSEPSLLLKDNTQNIKLIISSLKPENKKTTGLDVVPEPSLLLQDKPQKIKLIISSSKTGNKTSVVSNITDIQKKVLKDDCAEEEKPVGFTKTMTSLLKFTLNFDHFPTSSSMIKLAKMMNVPWSQVKNWFSHKRLEKRTNYYHLHNKVLKYCPYCENQLPFTNSELRKQHLYEEDHVKKLLHIEQQTYTSSSLNVEPNSDTSDKEDNEDTKEHAKPLYGPWNMASIMDLAQQTISELSSQESHVVCPLCFVLISHAQNLKKHLIERHLNKTPNLQKNIASHKQEPTKLVCSSNSAVNNGIHKQTLDHTYNSLDKISEESESSKYKISKTIDNVVLKALGFSSAENDSNNDKVTSTIDNVIMKALGFSSVSELPSTSHQSVEVPVEVPGPSLNDNRNNISQVKWKTPKAASPSPVKSPVKRKIARRSLGKIKELPSPEQFELLIVPLQQGWNREVVHRATVADTVHKKWDVYYRPPVGKKLRSSIEIGRHLEKMGIQDLTLANFDYSYKCLGKNVTNEYIRNASATKTFAMHKDKHNTENLHNETPVYYDELSYLLTPSTSMKNKSSSMSDTVGTSSTDSIKKSKRSKKNVDGATDEPLEGARAALVAKALEAAKSSEDTLVVPFNDFETDMDCADNIGIENETGEMTGFETWHTPSWDKQNDKEQNTLNINLNSVELHSSSKVILNSGISPAILKDPNDNENISTVLLHSELRLNSDITSNLRHEPNDHDNIPASVSDTHTQVPLKNTSSDRPKIRIKSMLDLQDHSEKVPDIENKPLPLKPLSSFFQFDNKNNMPAVSSIQTIPAKVNSGGIKKVSVLTGVSGLSPQGSESKECRSVSPIKVISISMNNEKQSPSKSCSHLNLEDIPFEEEFINDSAATCSTNVTDSHESESSSDSCSSNQSVAKRKRSDEDDLPTSKRDKLPAVISQNLNENSSFPTKTDIANSYRDTRNIDVDVTNKLRTVDHFLTENIISQLPSIRNNIPNKYGLDSSVNNSVILTTSPASSNNKNTRNTNNDIVELSDTENDNEIVELSDTDNDDDSDGFMPLICSVSGGKEVEEEFYHALNDDPSIVQDLDSSNSNTNNSTFKENSLQQIAEDSSTNQNDPPPYVLWMDKNKSYVQQQSLNNSDQGRNIVINRGQIGQIMVSSTQIPFTTVSQSRPVFTNASTSVLTSTTSKMPISYMVPSTQQPTTSLQVPLSHGQIMLNLQKTQVPTSTVITKTFQPMISFGNVSSGEKITPVRAIIPNILSPIQNEQNVGAKAASNPLLNAMLSPQEGAAITPTFKPPQEGVAITPTFKPVNTVHQQQPQIVHQQMVVGTQQESNTPDIVHVQHPLSIRQPSQMAQVVRPIYSQGQSNQVLSNSGTINCIVQQPVNQLVQQPFTPVITQSLTQVIQQQPLNQAIQQPVCQIVQQPMMQVSQQSLNQVTQQPVSQLVIPVSQGINQPGHIIPTFSPNTNQGLQQIQLPQQSQQMTQIVQNPQQRVFRVFQKSDGSLVLPQGLTLQLSPQPTSQVVRVPQPNQQNQISPTNQQGNYKQVIRLVQQPSSHIIQQNVGTQQPSGNQVPQQRIIMQKQSTPQVSQQQNVKATDQAPSSQTQVAKVTVENNLSLDDFVSHLFSS